MDTPNTSKNILPNIFNIITYARKKPPCNHKKYCPAVRLDFGVDQSLVRFWWVLFSVGLSEKYNKYHSGWEWTIRHQTNNKRHIAFFACHFRVSFTHYTSHHVQFSGILDACPQWASVSRSLVGFSVGGEVQHFMIFLQVGRYTPYWLNWGCDICEVRIGLAPPGCHPVSS